MGKGASVGRCAQIITADSSWAVLHSPSVLRMLACQITVEWYVFRIGVISYLFMYVCKGSGEVTVEIIRDRSGYDQTRGSQNARYLSAAEAV